MKFAQFLNFQLLPRVVADFDAEFHLKIERKKSDKVETNKVTFRMILFLSSYQEFIDLYIEGILY